MSLKDFFSKLFPRNQSRLQFPKDGILWRGWTEETQKLIAEKSRPFLLFINNPDPIISPFLKGVLRALPLNSKLREFLHEHYVAVMIRVDSLPELFSALGAGSRYHIAVLSPAGYTPMAVIDPTDGKPEEIAETIAKLFEKLQKVYQ